MKDRYDILIAGGRVAGSAAAIALAGAGYSVLLVERQKMPSDTTSTHVLWPDGLAALSGLGVLDSVLAAGAPLVRHFRLCRGEDIVTTTLTPYRGFDAFLCLRRPALDGILFEAASATSDVDAVDGCRLDDLLFDGDRVVGARLVSDGRSHTVHADLVVGADGRNSTVAAKVGAVEDDVVEAGRYWYYGYFNGANEPEPPAMAQSDSETDTAVGIRTDGGLHMVVNASFNEDFQEFRKDHVANYLQRVKSHPYFAAMLDGATLESPVYGMAGVRGYYRTMSGNGWVLTGDAAHQKDPIVARGINDALIAGLDLAEALKEGITQEGLRRFGETLRERTRTGSLMARKMSRPDRHMTADQAETLGSETSTPEGLSRVLGLEYGVTRFEDLFMTVRDGVVELPAER